MAKIGNVVDFDPNGQSPGVYPENPLAQGPVKGVVSGGSKPTPQATRPSSPQTQSSAPSHPQRIRGS